MAPYALDPAYYECMAWTMTLGVCFLAVLVTRYLARG